VAGSYNELEEVPGYLEEFRRERNEEAKKGAEEAVREERKGKEGKDE